jgi:alpha-glucosidase
MAPARDTPREWWRNAVVYQVYPRSFQDTDGDGVGDLPGVLQRLDHIERLGVDALWLSPIYPSPGADLGYDISDHAGVDPLFGALDDVDRLLAEAHGRGIHVLFDLVPSHTSIEHPWFRAHPERYIWSDDGPPNNWRAAFGGPAWSRDPESGRWYLHSFFPEQPDLSWRHPDVPAAVGEVIRFWLDRGVDGFRVDAVNRLVKDARLRDDPPARSPYPLYLHPELAELELRHSDDQPDVGIALAALREAAGDAPLVGETYVPTAGLERYLEHLDVALAFEPLHAAWEAERLREVVRAAVEVGRCGWILSNHDFARLASRVGAESARGAALLYLTLPGPAFVFQGDELGMPNGSSAEPPIDRAGRDPFRTPMPWEPGPGAGFTTGHPWLPLAGEETPSVAEQEADGNSSLAFFRSLIGLRRELSDGFELLRAPEGVLAYRRGRHVIAINLSTDPVALPWGGESVLATGAGRGRLVPGGGIVLAAS